MPVTKRARRNLTGAKQATKKRRAQDEGDAIVDSFLMESDGDTDSSAANDGDEDPYEDETPEERRVRLAKQFLAKVETMEKDSEEEQDEDETDVVQRRLQTEVYRARGTLHRRIAEKMSASALDSSSVRVLRGHKRSGTCVVVSSDEGRAYSGAKDGCWISWDVETGCKLGVVKASAKALLSVAVDTDGTCVAVAGADSCVHVFDARSHDVARTLLQHHRDRVTSVAFRARSSSQLYSGSADRCVKVWDVGHAACMDTLFGHQASVTGVAALQKERVLSCGLDGTLRLFKVAEESQLVYRSACVNVDAVAMVSETQFVSAAQDGSLSLWRAAKKKAVATVPDAHGPGNWINAVAACTYTDLVASGSNDGVVRLWRLQEQSLVPLAQVPVPGFVTGLSVGSSGRVLAASLGPEPRLGRWKTDRKAKSGVAFITLSDKNLKHDPETAADDALAKSSSDDDL